ncbi:MAG TPA: YggS family pyridoxal phosphate-dependent enzyme [Rhodanobacteraceae bacterium]|nr:YggS family pyridoxal phosphate-dependent enzyme [Rhodanobacteraceae bacterium]
MNSEHATLAAARQRIEAAARAAGTPSVALVAASKTRPAATLRAFAAAGQHAFGENYVAEARAKQAELPDLALEWHAIGPLQSNKCAEVARHFDWLQSLDRPKLVPLLARARPAERGPLNVLVQVNIDHEASKSGCQPAALPALAEAVAAESALRLRGIMAIPAPWPDTDRRRRAFAALRALFEALRRDHPAIDTLSMGMSDDHLLAIAEGATMVRLGTTLFGPRPRRE